MKHGTNGTITDKAVIMDIKILLHNDKRCAAVFYIGQFSLILLANDVNWDKQSSYI